MNKKIILLYLLVIALFSAVVYAPIDSVVITQPTSGDTLKGTAVEFNGTFTATGVVSDSDLNVSIYMGQIGSLQGQRICSNTTLDLTGLTWACKVDLNALNDNSSISINATVGNQTGAGGGATQQSSAQVTFVNDDTVPNVRFKRQLLNAKTFGDLPADCSDTSDNIDGTPTYQINLVKPNGNNATTIVTSSTGTFRGGDIDMSGIYTLSCVVQDNAPSTAYKGTVAIANPAAANSARATTSITISGGKVSPQVAEATGLTGTGGISTTTLAIGGFVVLLVLFGVFGKK